MRRAFPWKISDLDDVAQRRSQRQCDQRQSDQRRRDSAGYTLLELLLVLVVLVMVLALAWPVMTRRLSNHELREASMQVAEAIAETRMNAMDSGEPWVFRYWPQTGRYESGPLFRDPTATSTTPASDTSEDDASISGIRFSTSDGPSKTSPRKNSARGATAHAATSTGIPRPQVETRAGELPVGFVLQTQHPGAVDDWLEDDKEFFDEQSTASGLRVEDDGETNLFASAESTEELDLSTRQSLWIVFDSLGKTEDFEVIVAAIDQRSSLAVNVRGVTGAVSLGDPQHVIEESEFDSTSSDGFDDSTTSGATFEGFNDRSSSP